MQYEILLDENLSHQVIPALQAACPESPQVALLNLNLASDQDIWQYAKKENYCIVTKKC